MTGNVVFLGFAWSGDATLSAGESLLALLGFMLARGTTAAEWTAPT